MTQLSLACLAIAPPLAGLLLLASTGLISHHHWQKMRRRPVNRALAVLALGLLITCPLAEQPGEAWLGLVHFLPYFWVCAAQAELIQTPTQLRRLAVILALTVVPLVTIGLGELYLGWASPPGLTMVLPWPPAAGGTPPGRMASVFGYANHLALYLNVTWTLTLTLLGAYSLRRAPGGRPAPPRSPVPGIASLPANATADATAYLPTPKAPAISPPNHPAAGAMPVLGEMPRQPPCPLEAWFDRPWLWLIVLLFNGLGLILTQSRSAWALAVFSLLCLAAYRGWSWIVTAVVSAALVIWWSAFGPVGRGPLRQLVPELIWARLTDQNFGDRPLPTLRWSQWQFAWQLAQDRPLTGWGLRNFSPLYEAATQTWMGHPHSLLLMLGAETGLFLTGGLLGWAGCIFYRGIEVIHAKRHLDRANSYLFFGILITFLNVSIFHLFDVPLFDFRINALGWMVITQILGVVYLSDAGNLYLGRIEQYSAD